MDSPPVNRPTNKSLKERDVEHKLQLYGIITAFRNGKFPTNENIDVAVNTFVDEPFMLEPSKLLSPQGQVFITDLRDVIERAKYLLLTKNSGNLLQELAWNTQHADFYSPNVQRFTTRTGSENEAMNDDHSALRVLGTLIIHNGEFRKLLSDATVLLREVAADAASSTANEIAPSEEQRSQVDKPAPSPKDIKGKSAVHEDAPSGSRSTGQNQGDADNDPTSESENRTWDTVKDNARRATHASQDQAKNYLSSKFPEERRKQFFDRLKKMIVEIQGNPDYTTAVDVLLNMAEDHGDNVRDLGRQTRDGVLEPRKDSILGHAELQLKELIERFANYTSTDDLWDSIGEIYRDADRDPELKRWFSKSNKCIRKSLQTPGYVLGTEATNELNRLYEEAKHLLGDRYKNQVDRVLDELRFLKEQVEQDQMCRQFGEACRKLFADIGYGKNGKPALKPSLANDLSEIVLPAIFENIRYLPIPRLEYSDPDLDVVIDNLVIESDNFMPNAVDFANDNYFRWARKNIASRSSNTVMISVTGMQMDIRDVSYYVKKKTGFPILSDIGVADVLLYGSGLSFKLKISVADAKDRQSFFRVDDVNVDVSNFNVRLKQAKHLVFFGLFSPIMHKVMRPALKKVLEKLIRDKFNELDEIAYSIKLEADRMHAEGIRKDPRQNHDMYSCYASAARNKFIQRKDSKRAATAKAGANAAVTPQESIFPHIVLPGGISQKVDEYRRLAAQGDRWESPIFNIGTADKTRDVPPVGPVKRKPHETTKRDVRDSQHTGRAASTSANDGNGDPEGSARQDNAVAREAYVSAQREASSAGQTSSGSGSGSSRGGLEI